MTEFEVGDTVVVTSIGETKGEVVEVRDDGDETTYVVDDGGSGYSKWFAPADEVTTIEGTRFDLSDVEKPVRVTYVGCGKAKRELTGHPNHAENQYAAANLYTSNYFRLKREYAERMSYSWRILSAKHASIPPFTAINPYDLTISDYPIEEDDDRFRDPSYSTVDDWRDSVLDSVEGTLDYLAKHDAHAAADELVFLAGRDYTDPLRDGLAKLADEYDVEVRFPFDSTSGIGEQMSWLKNATDDDRPVGEAYASIFSDELDDDRPVDEDESTAEVATDGGTTDCGRRTCDRDSVVGFAAGHGGTKARCAVHALADGVDGVGESRAEDILDAIALDELVERVDGADGTHAPTVLSRIDGLGPTSAASIAENIDQSAVASAVREGDD